MEPRNHGSIFHVAASSQTQGTHLQLLKEQGKNGSTVEWQSLNFVQPNKQNHSELKVIDSCYLEKGWSIDWMGLLFHSRVLCVTFYCMLMLYDHCCSHQHSVRPKWENMRKPSRNPYSNTITPNKIALRNISSLDPLFFFTTYSSHVLPMLPHQGFSHPPKNPGRERVLGRPSEAKFPTPSPCEAGRWHGTKDLQTASWLVDPGLVYGDWKNPLSLWV